MLVCESWLLPSEFCNFSGVEGIIITQDGPHIACLLKPIKQNWNYIYHRISLFFFFLLSIVSRWPPGLIPVGFFFCQGFVSEKWKHLLFRTINICSNFRIWTKWFRQSGKLGGASIERKFCLCWFMLSQCTWWTGMIELQESIISSTGQTILLLITSNFG